MPPPLLNHGKRKGIENLRPMKKGDPCRNPKGRPKSIACIPDILRKIGDEPVPPRLLSELRNTFGQEFSPKNFRDAVLRVTYAKAIKGDESARQFIAERTEGKVTDRLSVEDTTPTRVIFEVVRPRE